MKKIERIVFCSGKKIVLRPLIKRDIPQLLVWFNDPEVNQYLTGYLPLYEKEEEEWFERLHRDKQTEIVLAIETKKGNFIGNIGLHRIRWTDGFATLGITIGNKHYWGQNYGSDAIMTILKYAFNTLNLRKICLSVLEFNQRAYRCYYKCGFREEGRKKKQYFKNGRYVDEIQMAIFKRDFKILN